MTDKTFDWSECLRLSGSKEELANHLLKLFKKELPTFQTGIKEAIKSQDFKQLQHHAHKLHGACCYTGVPRLKALTEQLETQTQKQQLSQLNALVNDVDQEINQVILELNKRK